MASADRPGILAPPPLVFLAGLGLGFGLEALLPDASVPDAVRWIAAPALIAGGLALQGAFIALFVRAGTHIDPYRPTKAIVTGGPYRMTRNPGYLGFVLIFCGIALLTSALWALAALVPTLAVIDRGVVAREERYLERKFGEEYLAYKRRVRRWL